MKIEIGKYYYYAKCPKIFKCVSVGKVVSSFTDYKGIKHKFYNGDMYLKKWNYKIKWHNWFAWYPVWIDGSLALFEVIERRWVECKPKSDSFWYYRRIDNQPKNLNFI